MCMCLTYYTGSGKTLAYLAPVMQLLKHEEETIGVMARVNRPRAIILCPSRELASQVLVSIASNCLLYSEFLYRNSNYINYVALHKCAQACL